MSENWVSFFNSTGGQFVAGIASLVLFLVIIGNMFRTKKMSSKTLTFVSLAIAMAVILSFVKIPWVNGGSFTILRMFCISLIGFWFGPATGILAGITYGFLDFAIKPNFFVPVQAILDYPLAFGMLGLSGFFSNKKNGIYTGLAVGAFGRLIMHTISGAVFFKEYAGGQNPFIYSLIYNGSYIIPEVILSSIIISIPTFKKMLNQISRTSNLQKEY